MIETSITYNHHSPLIIYSFCVRVFYSLFHTVNITLKTLRPFFLYTKSSWGEGGSVPKKILNPNIFVRKDTSYYVRYAKQDKGNDDTNRLSSLDYYLMSEILIFYG